MKKKYFIYFIIFAVCCVFSPVVNAQEDNNLFFVDDGEYSFYIDPSNFPVYKEENNYRTYFVTRENGLMYLHELSADEPFTFDRICNYETTLCTFKNFSTQVDYVYYRHYLPNYNDIVQWTYDDNYFLLQPGTEKHFFFNYSLEYEEGVIYTQQTWYDTEGNNFFLAPPVPINRVLTLGLVEVEMTETMTKILSYLGCLAICGIGCLALLMALKILAKVFSNYLPKS